MVWIFIWELAKQANKNVKICEVAVRKITSYEEEKIILIMKGWEIFYKKQTYIHLKWEREISEQALVKFKKSFS